MNIGYYNGTVGPLDEMMIPMNDRAVYFGDGVYDATVTYNGVILDLKEHVTRFYSSLSKLSIPAPMEEEALKTELQRIADMGEKDTWYMLYWAATRGTATRLHVFPEGKSNLMINLLHEPGLRRSDETMRVITFEDHRFEYCDAKTLNLIPSCLAAQAAKEAGCEEAIFHRGDIVTECAHSNVSIIKDGTFITAPTDHWILPGTARRNLINSARAAGIPVREIHYTLADLFDADEIIVSSSSDQLCPVREIDGKAVGGKAPDVLKRIAEKLADHINAQYGFEAFR